MSHEAAPRWDEEEVIDFFDTNLGVTLSEIATLSGWSTAEIKKLLLGKG